MSTYKNRGLRKRVLEYISIFGMAPFLTLFTLLSKNAITLYAALFAIGYFLIFLICERITKKGHNKIFKEFFNALWNYETAIVFCYGLYSYIYKTNPSSNIADIFLKELHLSSWTFIISVILLTTTVLFRFALSVTDLLVPISENNIK